MVEHLKNFGVGVILVSIIVAISFATNMIMNYIGADAAYIFIAALVAYITYVFGSLARIILFNKNIEK